jgi:hypothetical protein
MVLLLFFLLSSLSARANVGLEIRGSYYTYKVYTEESCYALGPNLLLNFNDRIGARIFLGRMVKYDGRSYSENIFSPNKMEPFDGLFDILFYFPVNKFIPYVNFGVNSFYHQGIDIVVGGGFECHLNRWVNPFLETSIFLERDDNFLRVSVGTRIY